MLGPQFLYPKIQNLSYAELIIGLSLWNFGSPLYTGILHLHITWLTGSGLPIPPRVPKRHQRHPLGLVTTKLLQIV